jgi:UDP-N-acetylmuramoyl-tripeptide--D-alanyl-D-alanine ligase
LPLAGEAAAIDFLAALAAADAIAGSLSDDEVAHALGTVQAIEGRARMHRLGTVQLIDDAYNANPSSMLASLQMVVEVARGARIGLVLGDMKELGPLTVESHRELAECIRQARPGWIILCGQAVRHTYDRLEDLGLHAQCVADAGSALVEAQRRIEPGDVVLVKGSRSLGLERVVSGLASGGAR